jgi:ssRNA-specific RNase YbeY (16S rRNA maturation enzyme)
LEQLGLDRRLARRLATVLGGHHGIFHLLGWDAPRPRESGRGAS